MILFYLCIVNQYNTFILFAPTSCRLRFSLYSSALFFCPHTLHALHPRHFSFDKFNTQKKTSIKPDKHLTENEVRGNTPSLLASIDPAYYPLYLAGVEEQERANEHTRGESWCGIQSRQPADTLLMCDGVMLIYYITLQITLHSSGYEIDLVNII